MNNKKLSRVSLGLIILIFLVFIFAAGFFLSKRWLNNLPGTKQQIRALNQTTLSIIDPENHSRYPLDAAIPITVTIQSEEKQKNLALFVGDKLIGEKDLLTQPDETNFLWQPTQTGKFILQARLTTADNQNFFSPPLTLTITDAVGVILWIETQGGETLTELSEKYDSSQTSITAENPEVDFSNPLPENISLKIPVFSSAQPQIIPTTEQPAPILPDVIAKIEPATIFQKLKTYIELNLSPAEQVPQTPEIQGIAVNCDAQLTIIDHAENEDGFFVYRTLPGSSDQEKIATLFANENAQSVGFSDPSLNGKVIYIVSAFNSAGENSSSPVEINFPAGCAAENPIESTMPSFSYQVDLIDGGLTIQDNLIHFQQPVDLAYLYISINGRDWERIPPGNQKFLSGDGDKFDLDIYLEQIINEVPDTQLEIDMEIWGWSGKNLVDCGTIHVSVKRTVLRVCGIAGFNCDEKLLSREINLPPASDPETLTYFFQWETAQMNETDDFVWQVAAKPFTGEYIRSTQSLIISRGVYNVADFAFKFDLSYLYKEGPVSLGQWPSYGDNFDSNFFDAVYPKGTPFTLYVRVLPFDKEGNQLPVSNTVIIHSDTAWEDPTATIYASNLRSRYLLEFLPETYRAPILVEENKWGCIVYDSNAYYTLPHGQISIFDLSADPGNCGAAGTSICNGKQKDVQYYAGTTVCPANYKKPSGFWNDVKTLAGGIVNGVLDAWEYVSNTLENAKQYLAEQVASVIPGCDAQCTAWVKKGLEAGFTALTGIPPTLPNYNELMDEGIDYAVDLAAQEIGPLCDDLCKEAIRYGLQTTLEQAKSNQPAPGCANAGTAHAVGKEPFCPNLSGVSWHPAPGSVYEPALIQLRISRPPTSGNIPEMTIPQETHEKYRVRIVGKGYNDTRIGDWFSICGFREGLTGDNVTGYNDAGGGYPQKRQINDPLSGDLYLQKTLTLPRLTPGESLEIPLVFEASQFWRLNHVYDVNMAGVNFDAFYANCGDDWPYLYYDGLTQFYAVEECLNDQNIWVPCTDGGSDDLELSNPSAP